MCAYCGDNGLMTSHQQVRTLSLTCPFCACTGCLVRVLSGSFTSQI